MKIYIYRHGQTIYNVEGIVQGRGVDSSLNEVGQAQAQAFYEYYKHLSFDRILTSSLKRTIETAAPFETALEVPVERLSDLDEINWGVYEGKKADPQMREDYVRLLQQWREGVSTAAFEGGDSALDMQERLLKVIEYFKSLEDKQILVCTHGGCLAYLMTLLQEQPLSTMPEYKHQNTGLCVFQYDGSKFHLLLQDDTSHLAKLT